MIKEKDLIIKLQNMRKDLGVYRDSISSKSEIAGEYTGDAMAMISLILKNISKEKVDR